MRANLTSAEEIKNIVIADAVLIIAFSLTLSGGLFSLGGSAGAPDGFLSRFLYIVPIAAIAISLSFVLHELMHKFVAQHYGAIAGFRTSMNGLIVTLLTGAFGFLVGIPGATMIFASSFTKRENGIVSIAGPLTNFFIFGVALALVFIINPPQNSYLANALAFTIFISILLAFFNMLPMYPLDGSKVLAWNPVIYIVTMGAIFFLMWQFTPLPLTSILYLIVIAFVISLLYRQVVY